MGKESGQNGALIGSAVYFAALNREHWIAAVMLRPESWDYAAVLREVAARAADTAEQVWGDLKRRAAVLRQLPAGDCLALAKIMEGLAEVCALGGAGGGRCRDCAALLRQAVLPLPSAGGADGSRPFTGRCGYAVGSEAYLAYVEERVFLGELPPEVGGRRGDRAYRKQLETSLKAVARHLEWDLAQGDKECVTGENAERLRRAARSLADCGVGAENILLRPGA